MAIHLLAETDRLLADLPADVLSAAQVAELQLRAAAVHAILTLSQPAATASHGAIAEISERITKLEQGLATIVKQVVAEKAACDFGYRSLFERVSDLEALARHTEPCPLPPGTCYRCSKDTSSKLPRPPR